MNELIPTHESEQGNILVSGRDLHDFLKIKTRYNDWFSRMIAYGFDENVDFVTVTQKRVTAQGNTANYIDHHLKLDMAKEIAMIQRSELGKQARRYFLQLERLWNSPEMIMKRALQMANNQIIEMKKKIALDKPKVLFADSVSDSESLILIGGLAKVLKQNGVDIGARRLFQWLRANGYLIRRKGTDYNMPTQKSMELGLFRIKETSITHSNGFITVSRTPKVTGKGQTYFVNKFLKSGVPV